MIDKHAFNISCIRGGKGRGRRMDVRCEGGRQWLECVWTFSSNVWLHSHFVPSKSQLWQMQDGAGAAVSLFVLQLQPLALSALWGWAEGHAVESYECLFSEGGHKTTLDQCSNSILGTRKEGMWPKVSNGVGLLTRRNTQLVPLSQDPWRHLLLWLLWLKWTQNIIGKHTIIVPVRTS